MDEYLAWFLDVTHWHWFALALVLAGFEMLSMSFFLIFPALSAVMLGLVVFVEPTLDWRVQVLVFAAFSVATTMIGRAWIRKFRAADGPLTINVRGQTYLGRRVRTIDALENGRGRLRMDDTWWTARSLDGAPIAADTLVEVAEVDGATLLVREVAPE